MLKIYFKTLFASVFRFMHDGSYRLFIFFIKYRALPRVSHPFYFKDFLYFYKSSIYHLNYNVFVDKIKVREFVKDKIGGKYLIPIYASWDSLHDFSTDILPSDFVLKFNGGSGNNLVVRDFSKSSLKKINSLITAWFKSDYYSLTREPQYLNTKPVLFAEMLLSPSDGPLFDYKVYCFGGKPEFIQVIFRDSSNQFHSYFDVDWVELDVSRSGFQSCASVSRPSRLDELLHCAAMLSNIFPFCRVDFYIVDQSIYFGELTFIPVNGHLNFLPVSFDMKLADLGFKSLFEKLN